MNSKSINNRTKLILITMFVMSIVILILIFCYNHKHESFTINNYHNKHKYLFKIKDKCKGKHLIPADSPEICCKMKHGSFVCDHNKNCRCKDIRTGICKVCYPKVTWEYKY